MISNTCLCYGGGGGIRTPGPVTVNSFQDCRNRPLCQPSGAKVHFELYLPKKLSIFFAVHLHRVETALPIAFLFTFQITKFITSNFRFKVYSYQLQIISDPMALYIICFAAGIIITAVIAYLLYRSAINQKLSTANEKVRNLEEVHVNLTNEKQQTA